MTVSIMSVMMKRKTEEANKSEKVEEEVEEIRSGPDAECCTSCWKKFTNDCCGCNPTRLLY